MTRRKTGTAGTDSWAPGGLTCEDVRGEVARLLADDLSPAAARKVRAHLAACRHCFSRVEMARTLRAVTRTRFAGARAPAALARRVRALVAAVAVLALLGGGAHAEKKKNKDVKTGAITGTVIDLACQILGEKPDAGHKGCAEGGVPVGLVDAKGRVWVAINASYGSATALLLPYMGQKVKAEGWYVERKGGERLISITTVTPVDGAPKAAAKPSAWVCPHHCGGEGEKAGACPKCGLEMVKHH